MTVSPTLQPLFLLSDEPIGFSGDDGLGMNQTARVIAEAALGAATPFTVGIFGAWGHGKTSLLNAARTLLEPVAPDGTITRPHPHVVTVQFNAWRYEKEEHPIVPLVASIAKAVKQRLDEDRTFGQAVGKKGKAIATTLYDGALSLITAVKLDAKGRFGVPTAAQVEGGIAIDAGAAQKNYAERKSKREEAAKPRIQSWIDQSLYLSAFDDLARLHAGTKQSGSNKTAQAPVIVVFIDDLDRCRPEAAVEILEGIKLVLAQPGFVFVLALYREVIERYLDRQSEVRYGEKHKAIGEGYIDKIVQLPLWLPSHEGAFEAYIRQLIDTKLKPGLMPHKAKANDASVSSANALLHAVYQCTPLLARLSSHSPRKLVRKINELLIDDRLLPENAHTTINCEAKDRRALLFPLLLIQRALLELPLPQQIKPLLENDELCDALAKYQPGLTDSADADGNVAPMLFREALKAKSQEGGVRKDRPDAGPTTPAPGADDPELKDIDAATAARWLKATDCLSQNDYRAILLNTAAGRAWLANHAGRRLVARAIAKQAVPAPASVPTSGDMTTNLRGTGELTARTPPAAITMSEELQQEVTIIERVARLELGLGPKTKLDPEARSRVSELDLGGEPITDAGAAWLASPSSGFKGLEKLHLYDTQVTDRGASQLVRADSSLKLLRLLDLNLCPVDDFWIQTLGTQDTGVKPLEELRLGATRISDATIACLCNSDFGFGGIRVLKCWETKLTDESVDQLTSPTSALKNLALLDLNGTQISKDGLMALIRAGAAFKSLRELRLAVGSFDADCLGAIREQPLSFPHLTALWVPKGVAVTRAMTAFRSSRPDCTIRTVDDTLES